MVKGQQALTFLDNAHGKGSQWPAMHLIKGQQGHGIMCSINIGPEAFQNVMAIGEYSQVPTRLYALASSSLELLCSPGMRFTDFTWDLLLSCLHSSMHGILRLVYFTSVWAGGLVFFFCTLGHLPLSLLGNLVFQQGSLFSSVCSLLSLCG